MRKPLLLVLASLLVMSAALAFAQPPVRDANATTITTQQLVSFAKATKLNFSVAAGVNLNDVMQTKNVSDLRVPARVSMGSSVLPLGLDVRGNLDVGRNGSLFQGAALSGDLLESVPIGPVGIYLGPSFGYQFGAYKGYFAGGVLGAQFRLPGHASLFWEGDVNYHYQQASGVFDSSALKPYLMMGLKYQY